MGLGRHNDELSRWRWPLRLVLCFWFLGSCCIASATPTEEKTHTVQAGETLGGIAQQHGVRSRDLQIYNDLSDPNRIREGQVLRIPPGPDVPIRYVVMPGDTLGFIARNHGVPEREIIELNTIANPDRLRKGQVLLIPGSARQRGATLPRTVREELDRIRVRQGWTHIVLHHSGTPQGNVRDMDRYHREQRRMVNGLGYHFVIGNGNGMRDGEIGIGPRWRRQQDGGHLASAAQNRYSIGICLIGNFEVDHPTARQMESLRALVRYLQQRSNIPRTQITTHTLINIRPTACPGRNFPTEAFIQSL